MKQEARAAVLRSRLRRLARRPLDAEDLRHYFKSVGLRPGGIAIVHSSMNSILAAAPGATLKIVLDLLIQCVGPEGTIFMPTYSFRGKQEHHAQRTREFDVQRSPSAVGLLTEAFRRKPGVIRSLHPTHSIAGLGPHAVDVLSCHHLGTAFGVDSPIFRMGQLNGIAVGLGVEAPYFAPVHVPEELHPETHAFHYGNKSYSMLIRDGNRTHTYELIPMRADRERFPHYARVTALMTSEGLIRVHRRGGLLFGTVAIAGFIKRAQALAEAGLYSAPRGT